MTDTITAIVSKIRALETALEGECAKQQAGLRYGFEHGKVVFEEEVARRHRELQTGLARYLLQARLWVVISAPIIYSLILPFAVLDAWTSLYQAICFRVYGIPQVKRSGYMVFDRAGLGYLNTLEKINCAYCSYVNGVIAYVREIGARTEQYWCPIKHARRVLGAHPRYPDFQDYGQGEDYHEKLCDLRAKLATETEYPPCTDSG